MTIYCNLAAEMAFSELLKLGDTTSFLKVLQGKKLTVLF